MAHDKHNAAANHNAAERTAEASESAKKAELNIGLVLPDVLGTYGDDGNALVLRQRARMRGFRRRFTRSSSASRCQASSTPIPWAVAKIARRSWQ